MKAGAFTPATPRLRSRASVEEAEPARSMKAGAFTPATRDRVAHLGRGRTRHPSLNEGGGLHPRNPTPDQVGLCSSALPTLNEGGGLHPRNPGSVRVRAPVRSLPTLNEGGGLHPRNPAAVRSQSGDAGPPQPALRPLNEGGGLHPRNPTGSLTSRRRPDSMSLNEGGGLHPRNPRRTVDRLGERRFPRSMKAGAFTPATPAVPIR